MAANDQAPACRKAATTLSPAARIEIGTPVASGATAWTARAKRHKPSSVSSSRRGKAWMRARPSRAIQSATMSAGSCSTVTGPA